MAHHFTRVRLAAESKFASSLPHIASVSNPRIRRPETRIKNDFRKADHKFLVSRLAASLLLLQPAACHAAPASLPWDYTLLALQGMLISTVAPAAIALAFTGAAILYALGGHDKEAGRLFGAGIGGCFALAVVYLLNYLLP
jgi:hypothetical protein